MAGNEFPKGRRLRRRAEFEALRQGSRKASRGKLLLVWRWSPRGALAWTRLGITASSKVGNAVRRNALKRWVREWFRTQKEALPRGLEILVVARPGAFEAGHSAVAADLAILARALQPPRGKRADEK